MRRAYLMEEIDIWRTAKILIDAHGDPLGGFTEGAIVMATHDGFPE
jgi:hypothetical protein